MQPRPVTGRMRRDRDAVKTYLVQVCRWCLRPTWLEVRLQCESGSRKPDFLRMLASEMPTEFPREWYSRRKLRAQNEPIVVVTVEE